MSGTVDSEALIRILEPSLYADYSYYNASSTGQQFVVDAKLEYQLFGRFLPGWLNDSSASTSDDDYLNLKAVLGDYLFHEDLETSFSKLAATLSSLVRSNISEGNSNATVLHGDAFVKEPFLHVQWPWPSVMLVELALTAGLLYVTVVRSARDPLLKTSTVAFLLHGLQGWSKVQIPERESRETLNQLADRMVARLEQTEDESWRFVKLEDELDPFQSSYSAVINDWIYLGSYGASRESW
jgi:hypothetical protein